MPTAARLVSLFSLAFLGWIMAKLIEPTVLEEQQGGVWFGGFMLAGAIAGWRKLGTQVGNPTYRTAFNGVGSVLYASIIIIVCATILACFDAMGYHAYRTIDDLLGGITKNLLINLGYASDLTLVAYAALGGLIAGVLAEMTHRTWR